MTVVRSSAASFVTVSALIALSSCGPKYDPELPDSSVLGSPRGFHLVRAVTHFHSPYSWDACDKNGLPNGQPDPNCLAHIGEAICKNRLDFMFMTDHPSNMSNFEFDKLALPQLGPCSNGHKYTMLVGFESTIMAFGMSGHADPDPTTRANLYNAATPAAAAQLRSQTGAIIVVPHTESKTIDWIKSMTPDAIEIYNFHANVDPKIREQSLNWPPFEDLPGILTYLFDPYHSLQADFAFMGFVQIHPMYFATWDTLLGSGIKVTGLGGTDSHENIFPQKVSDGERFDSHRRIARIFSNYLLLQDMTGDAAKEAITLGRSWLAFEGLGTPVGMDYTAAALDSSGDEGTPVGTGDTLTAPGNFRLRVKAPTLYSESPSNGTKPIVRIVIKRVNADGTNTVVVQSIDSDAVYTGNVAAPYRAEVYITPLHLSDLLTDFASNAQIEYPWVLTNPIYITQ